MTTLGEILQVVFLLLIAAGAAGVSTCLPRLRRCIPYSLYEGAIMNLDDFEHPCDALVVARGCTHAAGLRSYDWATRALDETFGADHARALVRSGWPERVQQLVLEAGLASEEVRMHLREGTQPDQGQLEMLAGLRGHACRCFRCVARSSQSQQPRTERVLIAKVLQAEQDLEVAEARRVAAAAAAHQAWERLRSYNGTGDGKAVSHATLMDARARADDAAGAAQGAKHAFYEAWFALQSQQPAVLDSTYAEF